MAAFSKGLTAVVGGVYAYLQPDGGWGYSNAGLVVSGGEALVVDTLMDIDSAAEMLAEMGTAVTGLNVTTVVNTHAHPDHTAGNLHFPDAEIIASTSTRDEMSRMLAGQDPIAQVLANWAECGEAGAFLHDVMGGFNFDPTRQVLPSRTFDREITLDVGGTEVVLYVVGPAHTAGDVVVHLPEQRVLFTGDVMFHQVHPMIGAVPVTALRSACQRLAALDALVVVPGHGPITDTVGLDSYIGFLDWIEAEVGRRFDRGMSFHEAALDIPIDTHGQWADPERIVITTANLYRDLGAEPTPMAEVMGLAGRYRRARAGSSI